jgi:uncharacterized protein YjbI with pentapeptide repeats
MQRQKQRGGVDLRGADLRQANPADLPLTRMRGGLNFFEVEDLWDAPEDQPGAVEEELSMAAVHLEEADLANAQLQKAFLGSAQLQEAYLVHAQLQKADLQGTQLQGADLRRTDLERATLDRVTFSNQTYGSAHLADINWGNVNLAVVDWKQVTKLGDEQVAHQKKDNAGNTKNNPL